jgi:hypothetical protein
VSLDPAIDAFEASLYSTNPVSLLLTAEAAGRAADPSIAPRVAAMAVVTSLGFMLANADRIGADAARRFAPSYEWPIGHSAGR